MRLIDADALKETFLADSVRFKTEEFNVSAVETEIESAPTIDAAPAAHAHITGTGYSLHCSNCKESADIGNDYCPSCGAKMDAPNGGGV